MTSVKIGFGITGDWLNYTYVTMCSILSNANKNDDYKFYILSELTCDEFKNDFQFIKCKLNNIHPFEYEYIKMENNNFNGVVHDLRVGISAYYRLKLVSLTKEEKIIYLDSDVIVLDDISNLWNYNIENYLIGAVEDKYSSLMGYKSGLDEDEIYINSGVMLMNLKKFREQNLEDIIFKKLREENNDYSDQDVLNDICRNQILYLPLKYNLMLSGDDPNSFPTRKEEYKTSLSNPTILHYSIKPWVLPVQYSEYWRKYENLLK